MFDLAAFEAKIAAVTNVLPSLGNLIQAAQVVAPTAPGLAKANIVIQTVIAAEPAFAGMEALLGSAITGLVTAFRAAGTLPPAQPAPQAPPPPVTPSPVTPA